MANDYKAVYKGASYWNLINREEEKSEKVDRLGTSKQIEGHAKPQIAESPFGEEPDKQRIGVINLK